MPRLVARHAGTGDQACPVDGRLMDPDRWSGLAVHARETFALTPACAFALRLMDGGVVVSAGAALIVSFPLTAACETSKHLGLVCRAVWLIREIAIGACQWAAL